MGANGIGPVDSTVSHSGQIVATAGTIGIAVIALVLVIGLCRRQRVLWPLVVLAGGTATCLLEPLFDHLYGLWFPSRGEYHLFTTYGVHEPVWLPFAYLVVYGALPIGAVQILRKAPTLLTVARIYVALVAIAIVAEIVYIKVLGVYNYQVHQPFVVLGYPLFLGFVNSMSALISALVLIRLAPILKGASQLQLAAIPPMAFGVDAVGSGFLYLAARNANHPSGVLLHVGAVTVALGGALTVRLLAKLLPQAPAAEPAAGIGSGARADADADRPAARPASERAPEAVPARA